MYVPNLWVQFVNLIRRSTFHPFQYNSTISIVSFNFDKYFNNELQFLINPLNHIKCALDCWLNWSFVNLYPVFHSQYKTYMLLHNDMWSLHKCADMSQFKSVDAISIELPPSDWKSKYTTMEQNFMKLHNQSLKHIRLSWGKRALNLFQWKKSYENDKIQTELGSLATFYIRKQIIKLYNVSPFL